MATSRLTKFKEIDAAQWKIIEQMKTRDGRNINLLNIERNYPEKIKRTFCKCGYASGKIEDSCPVCGNKDSRKLEISSTYTYSRTIDNISKVEINPCWSPIKTANEDRVVGFENIISAGINSTADEFVFTETGFEKRFEIGEFEAIDYTTSSSRGYSRYSYSDFKEEVFKQYPYSTEGLNKFENGNSVSGLMNFVNYRNEMPVVINNIKKYPGIVNYIANLANKVPFKSISKWDEVYPILGIKDKELNPYIESLLNSKNSYWNRSSSNITMTFEAFDHLDEDLKPVAKYFLIHGDCNLELFNNFVEDLAKNFNPKEADVIMNFVRANYVSLGAKVLKSYKERKEFLKSVGVDVNLINMDIRMFNLHKNKEYMTSKQKYNEKRVNYFLEMFDLNPLESLKYLDSRRAPNKNLRKELADKLD